MSTYGTAIRKDDLLSEIWKISTTFTEEAMAAALKECSARGFDPERGIVPLQESFINLSSARNVLEDAIDKQKLIQLPLTVQKELLNSLQEISRALQSLMEGVDEIVNITDAIESLNTSIWKYGLHNLSDQILGYQRKLNQLKNQEVQLAKTTTELRVAQEAAREAGSAALEINQKRTEVLATVQEVKQTCETASELLEQIQSADAKTNALFSAIEQHEKQSGELTANIKTASHELSSLDGSIRKFYADIDEYRKKINQTTERATELITNSEITVSRLVQDATTRMDGLIEQVGEKSAGIAGEMGKKIEELVTGTKEAVEKLSTGAQISLTKLESDNEEKLSIGLKKLMTSSNELVTETEEKVGKLEKQFESRSAETIQTNQQKTDKLIGELATLKEQIREQIQQATGFTLFGAFQSRQNQIADAKAFWKWAIAVLAIILCWRNRMDWVGSAILQRTQFCILRKVVFDNSTRISHHVLHGSVQP